MALNQTGEEGPAIMVAAAVAVAAVVKVMAVMAKVMVVAPEVLVMAARLWPVLQRLGVRLGRSPQQRPRYCPLQPVVAKVASLATTMKRKDPNLGLAESSSLKVRRTKGRRRRRRRKRS